MNDNYENFKEQVRSQADIVKVVSDYVALKKKGRVTGLLSFSQ
jgi:DNA primase